MTAVDDLPDVDVAPLLRAAFRCLDQAGISWALLRGADELADPQSDVDVLVAGSAQSALEALRAAGFREVPGRGRAPHRFAHAFDPAAGRWLQLDVVDQLAFGPWQQLRTEWVTEVLERRVHAPVALLKPTDEGWLFVLHQVLDKRLPHRAVEAARALSPEDPVGRLLDARCGPGTAAFVLAGLAGPAQAAAALPGALGRRWAPRPVTLGRAGWARLQRVVHDGGRWRRGDGRTVAVLGPDGAGKSTLITGLRAAGFPVAVAAVYFGLWKENAWDPRWDAVPGGRFVLRVLRALRQALRVRYQLFRGRLVLLDRAPYDGLLGEVAGSAGGRLLTWLALRAAPRPDVVLLLDAPGELLFARKGEDSVELLEWRRRRFLRLAPQLPQLVVLDATAPQAEVLRAATAATWQGMVAPGRRRPDPPRPVGLAADGASHALLTPGDPLRAWRRLDWQFLLLRPLPDLVAVGGRYDDELVSSLRDVSHRRTTTSGPADLVVLVDPQPGELAARVRCAGPGTEFYVELLGSAARSLRSWRQAAERAGLVDVRVHWHVLSGGRRTRCVPLDDRPSLLDTLGRHDAIRFGRQRWLVARLTLLLGLLPAVLRHGSVTGSVPGGKPATGVPALEDLVWKTASRDGAVGPAATCAGLVLVTPSDPTSRHVVALGFTHDSRAPVVVAKVPRRVGDSSGVRREAELLPRLAALAPSLRAAVPRVLSVEKLNDYDALIMTALDGRPLTPARVRRDETAALRAGTAFAAALPITGHTDPTWYDGHVERPIRELTATAGHALPSDVGQRTSARLQVLRTVPLPTVFEHGDLSDPNLLLTAQDSLQVLDWERGDEAGLPGHDLVLFLTYIADARAAATSNQERVAAFCEAFVGPSAWARPWLDAHLKDRGIDLTLRPALVLACWARTSATLVPRMLAAHPAGTEVTASFGSLVADEPDVRRWLCALDRFEEL